MAEPGECCRRDGDLLRCGLGEAALELVAAGFASLWHGVAVDPGDLLADRRELAGRTARDLARVGRAELDAVGRLVGIHGLTLQRTRHWLEEDGRVHHTWCAFDSVGIPAALGLDATASTECPSCGTPIRVDVRQCRVEPGGAVLWLPPPPDVGGHLMNEFCAAADLYCTVEHLHARVGDGHGGGRVVALLDVAPLGREVWADVAGVDVRHRGGDG